ncbi:MULTISPECIES: Zn-ribbon domain-containing OB-fold protein [Haloferax]|uniref:Nucleic acid-binding protein n=2 Tax=Haloferax TaxID=2251 RepID=A0A6G1Z5Z4_9EURY|nr:MULTISPECIES: OB-fold domain-containing protein [Haloferax]KAB1189090.1 nucleic acid-binding protein [Haloferax sp. CBA1149]MRW81821.1 nucleic acid-binding protein [Haloferax marinisediminis]
MADTGYDEWLAAIADGEGYYLACPDGHGSLPPRRSCPHCGDAELTEEPLPETGTVVTFTEIHVPAPDFADAAPYVTAIATFGPVRLTGVVRDVPNAEVELGMNVTPDADVNETTGEQLLVFHPVDE